MDLNGCGIFKKGEKALMWGTKWVYMFNIYGKYYEDPTKNPCLAGCTTKWL